MPIINSLEYLRRDNWPIITNIGQTNDSTSFWVITGQGPRSRSRVGDLRDHFVTLWRCDTVTDEILWHFENRMQKSYPFCGSFVMQKFPKLLFENKNFVFILFQQIPFIGGFVVCVARTLKKVRNVARTPCLDLELSLKNDRISHLNQGRLVFPIWLDLGKWERDNFRQPTFFKGLYSHTIILKTGLKYLTNPQWLKCLKVLQFCWSKSKKLTYSHWIILNLCWHS